MAGVSGRLLGLLLLCCPAAPLSRLRWCALSDPELAKCSQMAKAFGRAGLRPELACVRAGSAPGCLAMIHDGLADAAAVDGGLVYRAGQELGLKPVAGESYGQGPGVSSFAVAVVRAGSGLAVGRLRGARSCHPGLNLTAGWDVPLGFLLDTGRMAALGCDLPAAAGRFFNGSCAPGARGPAYPEALCRLCKGDAAGEGRCDPSPTEQYYGEAGAFRCLAEGAGEVAFLKHSTVPETLRGGSPPGGGVPGWAAGLREADFELLCRDGSRAAVGAWRGCHWARVPAHAVVTRAEVDGGLVFQLLRRGQERFGGGASSSGGFQMFGSAAFGGKDLLFSDATVALVPIPGESYRAWLGPEYLRAMRGMDCDPTGLPESLRWCVLSTAEIQKCSSMAAAFKRQSLRPAIQCVSAESHRRCMEQIQKRAVDAVTLSGEDIYTAGRAYGLVPAAGERYAEEDANSTYYAVAVVRRVSEGDAFTVHELRGRRSCHTGYGRRAGWVLPVGLLLSKGLIQPRGCNVLEAVSAFFSASCIPTDQRKGYPPNLCELCVGDDGGNHKCEAVDKERYYGYAGAFRCLAESRGEVAFVKHTSVFENTDGQNAALWASRLRSTDFQLLCPNGGRAEVGQFAECHWGRVPPRAIMVHPETNALALYGLLDKAQDFFGDDENSNGFKMFSSSDFQGKDLIFKDATTAIVPAGERTTATAWLGQPFLEALEGWESSSSSPQCSGAAAKPVDLFLLLLMPSLALARCCSV